MCGVCVCAYTHTITHTQIFVFEAAINCLFLTLSWSMDIEGISNNQNWQVDSLASWLDGCLVRITVIEQVLVKRNKGENEIFNYLQ